jgi:phosphopantothenoylcysteine decarboxylase/phosphopantothenate--cysteine ligase
MRYLVTAGPTREFLDDVRFLSNASTGRMGCAIADAATTAGHAVTLVCGPVACAPPLVDTLVPVTSAAEMHRAVLEHLPAADVVVMAAAVADYRPAERVAGKIRKTGADLVLRLERTVDIAAGIGRDKARRVHVGFALEADAASDPDAARAAARRKLAAKHLDLIVLNGPAAMGSDHTTAELLFADGRTERLENVAKAALAERLVRAVAERAVRLPNRTLRRCTSG